MMIAGRSPLRLATFSLPTHREVVAAASRISALGAPHALGSPRLPCVPCCVSAFHAAAIPENVPAAAVRRLRRFRHQRSFEDVCPPPGTETERQRFHGVP